MSSLLNAPIKSKNPDPIRITEEDGVNLAETFDDQYTNIIILDTNIYINIIEDVILNDVDPIEDERSVTPPRGPMPPLPPSIKEERRNARQRFLKRSRTPSPKTTTLTPPHAPRKPSRSE